MKKIRDFSRRLFAACLVLVFLGGTGLLPAAAAGITGAPSVTAAGDAAVGELRLVAGGMPFGIRMTTAGVLVVGLSEVTSGTKKCRPAYDGGLRARDNLIQIDGKAVTTSADVTACVAASGGRTMTFTVLRGGQRVECKVTPVQGEGGWQCGLWIRDSASGIGTVTFLDPQSGLFGGLGHGVCDGETGTLLPFGSGAVLSVKVKDVIRGQAGKPGELRGAFTGRRLGILNRNTECGVFGVVLADSGVAGTPLPVATPDEVREGEATLRCTLGEDGVREYRVQISGIDRAAGGTRSFTVRVTDPALLERTGGIVQGMSGSPLIQNGRLIGAVTHVLVDDPTVGYGIFLTTMLSEMKMKRAA